MTSTRLAALLLVLFVLAIAPSLRADDGSRDLGATSTGEVEPPEPVPPPPVEDDPRSVLMVGAAFSTGFVAFNIALQVADIEEFGPRPVVTASLVASSLGFLLSHVGAFALLDENVYRDPRQRDLFMGLSLLGTSLGLLGFSVPSCFAVTSGPIPDDPESVAIVAPFFLAAMGVAGLITGAVLVGSAAEAPVQLAASTDGATLFVRGTF